MTRRVFDSESCASGWRSDMAHGLVYGGALVPVEDAAAAGMVGDDSFPVPPGFVLAPWRAACEALGLCPYCGARVRPPAAERSRTEV